MSDIRTKCADIMADIMEVDAKDINDETSPDTLDQWDSLSHVQLVLGLEKAFDIKISPEDGVEHFISFKDIVTYLENQG